MVASSKGGIVKIPFLFENFPHFTPKLSKQNTIYILDILF